MVRKAIHNTTIVFITTNVQVQIIIATRNCSNLTRIEMNKNGDIYPPIELPPMLNKIMLELVVRITVLDLLVGLKNALISFASLSGFTRLPTLL
jgi:hypothetical protein